MTSDEQAAPRPVLLFDGECGLCQACVRALLRADGAGALHYAPLQGAAAQAFLRAQGLPTVDFDTLIFVPDWRRRAEPGRFLVRTDAVLAACATVGGAVGALAELRVVPHGWRDSVYRVVARWRHRLFGAYRPRPLARAGWAQRFL